MAAVTTVARRRVIGPAGRFSLDVRELWEFRELLYFLLWRDVKVRYKQTAVGAAWAVIQPVVAMLVFTIVFGRFADIPSEGLPYPIFVFVGLLAWQYFSQAVGSAATSVVGNANLVTKVYFPRLYVPLAAVLVPVVDFAIASLVLVGLMAWYGVTPGWEVVGVIPFLLLAFLSAVGIGLWVASLNVRYRDVPYAIPFVLQIWMYASPVVYPLELVQGGYRLLFALNPMAGVIEGFRWSLLGTDFPPTSALVLSIAFAILVCVGGLAYFARVEQHFADVI